MTMGEMISMRMSDAAEIGVYHAVPAGERRGGVVLIQEIFGVTGHIRNQCERYASAGYEVLAPALFDREAPALEAGYGAEDIQRALKLAREEHPFSQSVQDTQTCIDALRARGPVFIVGYCYGGGVAWAAACRCDGLSAASAYYGTRIPQMANEKPRCPTILHFGRHDAGIPVEAVEKLAALHPEVEVHLYDAGHGFNSDRRAYYHRESTELARARTLALFSANGTAS
jgi:carboxymethylenebutenolidase